MSVVVYFTSAVCLFIALAGFGVTYYLANHPPAMKNKFKRASKEAPSELSQLCEICLYPISVGSEYVILKCKDSFHKSCLIDVLDNEVKNGRTCPKCRDGISEAFISNNFK